MPDDGRQYWLWVIKPQYYLEDDGTDRESLDPEDNYDPGGWWTCNKATKEGDLILLYRAKLKKDIKYLILAESDAYSIADDNDEGWDYGCDYQVLYKFENPVHIKDLRMDPSYDDWGPLRCSFQGSSFRISDEYWEGLKQKAASLNPGYQDFIERVLKEPIAEFTREKELEDTLVNNLRILGKFGYDLELYFDPESKLSGRQYVCKGNGGRIDLLCCDKNQNRYVVIELKNVRAGQNTFGQISNYMGWVQEKIAKSSPVDGLVISRGVDTRFESALKITDRIKQINVEDLGFAIAPRRLIGSTDPNGQKHLTGISKPPTTKQRIRDCLRIGNNLSKLGNYGEAIKAYEDAIKLDPTRPIAWNKKGIALYELGKYDDAIQAYDEAIRIDPKDSDGWYNKGVALLELSRYDEALQCVNEAIQLDPKIAMARENKGYFLNDMGLYEEAIQSFDEAIRLEPKDVITWNGKSVALLELGKYDEAIQCINEAIRLDPKNVDAWYNKGCASLELSRYGEGIQAYDEAIKLDPKLAVVWAEKGYALSRIGKHDEAIQAIDEGIRLDPKNSASWNNKGLALLEQKNYEEAIKAYDEAIKLDPELAKCWSNKGKALEAIGRPSEANAAYSRARELGWTE